LSQRNFAMYKYVNPKNKHLKELKQYGKDLIIDIILMLPGEFDKNTRLIAQGIETNNYEEIQRGIHNIKANLRYFIDVENPLIVFYQDFENRSKEKWNEQKNTGRVKTDVDFSPDLQKAIELSREPIEDIMRFKDDFEQSGN